MIPSKAYKYLIGHKYISLFKGGQKIKKHKAMLENLFNFALSLYYVPFTGKFCLFWDTLFTECTMQCAGKPKLNQICNKQFLH